MLNLAVGVILLFAQLTAPGGQLPQIIHPDFKAVPVAVGKTGEVTVSFNVIGGFSINRTPPIQLKLTPVEGLVLAKTDFKTPSEDPKAKDQYYVDIPKLKVPVQALKAGQYDIPGKLVYFFCSKTDGFCSRQVLDVKIPITAQ